jgi:hypothetical protein
MGTTSGRTAPTGLRGCSDAAARCVRTRTRRKSLLLESLCKELPMTPILEAGGLTRARRPHSDRSPGAARHSRKA